MTSMHSHDFGLLHVCGFPSSGTTLLRAILNSHPAIRIKNEMPLILPSLAAASPQLTQRQALNLLDSLERNDQYANFSNLDGARAALRTSSGNEKFSRNAIYATALDAGEYRWYGNKTPQYTEQLPTLTRAFPCTKVILIVRDVRAVALSHRKKWGKSVRLCATKWNDRMIFGKRYLESMDQKMYLIFRYEDIVEDPEMHCYSMCKFLDIEFSKDMLQHQKFDKDKPTGKTQLNYEPITTKSTRKWESEFTEDEIGEIEALSYESMAEFGYDPVSSSGMTQMSRSEKIFLEARDLGSAIVTGNRYTPNQSFLMKIRRLLWSIRRRIATPNLLRLSSSCQQSTRP